MKFKIRTRPTAAEVGAKVGRSARTVRAWAAIPRDVWIAERAAMRAEAARLRAERYSWAEVAKRVGAPSAEAARALAKRERVQNRGTGQGAGG